MTSASGSPTTRATAVAKALSPRQRAKVDAASILAAFIPPPGAQRLAGPPGDVAGKLDHPQSMPGDPDFVDIASLWQVRGMSPLQVLAWEKAHLPKRFRLSMLGDAAAPAPVHLPGAPPVPRDPYAEASEGFDLPGLAIIPAR